MPPVGRYIPEPMWPHFRALMAAWRRGELKPPPLPKEPRPGDGNPPLTVMLLEDLHNGQGAKAIELTRVTDRQVQDVVVVGYPVISNVGELTPTFTLTWQPEDADASEPIESEPFWINNPADGLEEILEKIPALKRRNLRVWEGSWLYTGSPELGYQKWTVHRWRIEMDFGPGGEWKLLKPGPLIGGGTAQVLVSNQPFVPVWPHRVVTVVCNIPVGDPTPLRAGAQCGVQWFPSLQAYAFIGAEPRKYEPPPDEIEPEYPS